VPPAQLSCCLGGESGRQVGGNGEEGAGDVFDGHIVGFHDAGQQLAGRGQDRRGRVCFDGGCATDASTGHTIPPKGQMARAGYKKERGADGSTLFKISGNSRIILAQTSLVWSIGVTPQT